MFELVVGEIQSILGNLNDDFDFSETVMSLWLKNQSQDELDTAFKGLADDLLEAKNQYQEISELDEQIFGEDFEA